MIRNATQPAGKGH